MSKRGLMNLGNNSNEIRKDPCQRHPPFETAILFHRNASDPTRPLDRLIEFVFIMKLSSTMGFLIFDMHKNA